MKRVRQVEIAAWNVEQEGGNVIAAGDFGHEDRRCWKVWGLQKGDRKVTEPRSQIGG